MQRQGRYFLEISLKAKNLIFRAALAQYAQECCGILLGSWTIEGACTVINAVEARNRAEPPTDAFLLDPADIARASAFGRRGGHEVVGFFHSHPNGSSKPSDSDIRGSGWPGYRHVIVAVDSSGVYEMAAYFGERDNWKIEPIYEVD